MVKKYALFGVVALTVLAVPAASLAINDITIDAQKESRKKAGVGPVIFPHARHEKKIACANCHPKIFKDKKGENRINMKGNMEGKFCGSPNCHNSPKAFALYECAKCHQNIKAAK